MSRERSLGYEYYLSIAEELSDEITTLADLEPEFVSLAKEWAKKNKKKWPPHPRTTGWQFQIHGWK